MKISREKLKEMKVDFSNEFDNSPDTVRTVFDKLIKRHFEIEQPTDKQRLIDHFSKGGATPVLLTSIVGDRFIIAEKIMETETSYRYLCSSGRRYSDKQYRLATEQEAISLVLSIDELGVEDE